MPVVGKAAKQPSTSSIDSFLGEYRFLSNFYPCEDSTIILDSEIYPTVEHAYQAAKFSSPKRRAAIRTATTPAEAKRLGRSQGIPDPDWDSRRISVMKSLLKQKFAKSSLLAEKLIATSPHELIEGNDWNDRFWGICNGKGSNNLGKLLMERREKLIAMENQTKEKTIAANTAEANKEEMIQKAIVPIVALSKRAASDCVVLHSSLAPFAPSTHDAEFPTFPRAIGVIACQLSKSGKLIVEQEWVTLTSIIRGEETTGETLESLTQDKVRELIARCNALALELTEQALRLEKQLRKTPLCSIPATVSSGARYVMSKVDEPSTPSRAPKPATAPKTPKPARTPFAESDLLAALDDD